MVLNTILAYRKALIAAKTLTFIRKENSCKNTFHF